MITTKPLSTPAEAQTSPGTTTPGARVASMLTAFAVMISPVGASADVPEPQPVVLPGQLSLFDSEVA